MTFLLRALDWYEESSIKHAIHSITKPAALRYDDLLRDIRRATRSIADLAIVSSQAEQRDMHLELQAQMAFLKQFKEDMVLEHSIQASTLLECRHALSDIQALMVFFKQFKEDMVLEHSIQASALLECRHALSDVQITQALTLISSACSVDHKSALQASLLIRDKHRFVASRSRCPPFWTSSELHAWNVGQDSSSITVRASFKSRFFIRDFCTNIIQELRNSSIPVLWVLKPKERIYHSVVEVLKSLIYQSLALDTCSRTDSKLSFQLRQFLDAQLDKDYVNLLGSSLQNFRLVYIMVEAGAMESASASRCREHLQELSRRLSERDAATILKIMVLSYGPDTRYLLKKDNVLLRVGRKSHRNGSKIPSNPLQSIANSEPQQTRRSMRNQTMPSRSRGRAVRIAGD